MYELRYRMEQINAAAIFIWENNKACVNWPDPCFSFDEVKAQILDDIRRTAAKNMANYDDESKWVGWIGFAGYWILFTSDDPNSIDAEVLVDPAVGNDKYTYIHEVID